MEFTERKLAGTFAVTLEPHGDARGFFVRTYELDAFVKNVAGREWVEESLSFSKEKGTVRGLHFQHPPHAEGKYLTLASGEAFLVWVDLRAGSPTFGQWDSMVLTAGKNAVYTPRGFANGLCTLSDDCTLLYKMDTRFHPESQDVIRWDDPDIGIVWPIEKPVVLSERDRGAASFADFKTRFGGLALS